MLRVTFLAVAVCLGLLQVWAYRFSTFNLDAIAYLDLADAVRHGNWTAACTAHWGVLYPLTISLVLGASGFSGLWEFQALKVTNFLNYLVLLGGWEFFLSEFLFFYAALRPGSLKDCFYIPEIWWRVSGSVVFLWAFLCLGGVYQDTADYLTAACLFLASGFLLRMRTRKSLRRDLLLMGVSLGLGYLAKAVVLPLSLVYFLSAARASRAQKANRFVFLLSVLGFVVIASPWVYLLSSRYGQISFASPGINAYVCGISFRLSSTNARGDQALRATLKHPTRKVYDRPEVYEFATPVEGTYPPWDDPTYWLEGLKAKFEPLFSLYSLFCNLWVYWCLFIQYFLAAWLIVVAISRRTAVSLSGLTTTAVVWLPGAAGFALYLFPMNLLFFPWIERYFPAFIALLFVGLAASLRLPDESRSRRAVKAMFLIVSGACFLLITRQAGLDLDVGARAPHLVYQRVAQKLQQKGIAPGDKVAVLGNLETANWARLARVKIVAEIPEPEDFWATDPATQRAVLQLLKSYGVRAVVFFPRQLSKDSRLMVTHANARIRELSWLHRGAIEIRQGDHKVPEEIRRHGWISLPGLHCYIYLL